jgi:hypothetical protein
MGVLTIYALAVLGAGMAVVGCFAGAGAPATIGSTLYMAVAWGSFLGLAALFVQARRTRWQTVMEWLLLAGILGIVANALLSLVDAELSLPLAARYLLTGGLVGLPTQLEALGLRPGQWVPPLVLLTGMVAVGALLSNRFRGALCVGHAAHRWSVLAGLIACAAGSAWMTRGRLSPSPFESRAVPVFRVGSPAMPLAQEAAGGFRTNGPHLLFIVIESLRGDMLDHETAPHLWALRQEAVRSADAVSAANATHVTWHALFNRASPLSYGPRARHLMEGSPLVRCLQSAGYAIHVCGGSNLGYYDADTAFFGADHRLTASFADGRFYPSMSIGDRDATAVASVCARINEAPSRPQALFVFLESTHHDYAWATDFQPPFAPYLTWDTLDYFTREPKCLLLLTNRYRNSIRYVDSLVGRMLAAARESGTWDRWALFVTGDHGEEFREKGHLFHASALTREQTTVPVFLRLPGVPPGRPNGAVFSHHAATILLDRYLREGPASASAPLPPYALCVAGNLGASPTSFFIADGTRKFMFERTQSAYADDLVALVAVLDFNDNPLPMLDADRHEAWQRLSAFFTRVE